MLLQPINEANVENKPNIAKISAMANGIYLIPNLLNSRNIQSVPSNSAILLIF